MLTFVHLNVDGTPPNIVLGGLFKDDTLVLGGSTSLLAGEVDEGTSAGNDGTFIPNGIFVELGYRSIPSDVDLGHVETGLGEVLDLLAHD